MTAIILMYLIDVTSHSRATAALHILLPKKPLPPHTTNFFFAADVAAMMECSAIV